MKKLTDASFYDKKVLIRVDFNVPLSKKGEVTDDSRIVAALPTIKKVVADGGSVIIISHLGRPKNGPEKRFSLQHVQAPLSKLLGLNVSFVEDCIGEKVEKKAGQLGKGEVLLLENLRFHKSEKEGCRFFAEKLSRLANVYINEAFGAAHREHASTSIIAQFFPNNKYFGYLLSSEINSLEKVLKKPKKPFTAIIGGAKISGKIDVIRALFEKVDNLIIGGGMAYTFVKAMGGNVGKSLVEEEKISLAKDLLEEAKTKQVNLVLPIDSVNAKNFSNDAKTNISNILAIDPDYIGLDIGEKSIAHFVNIIKNSKTIIWNGPMGVFEMKKFSNGTEQIANAICAATKSGAFSLIGGGDSVASLKKFGLTDKVSYLSTGGGAMLKYLEGCKLPAIEAILS